MSVYAGPNSFAENIILDLDAANTKSYSGSGSSWYDLSNNKYIATMSNCTFSSSNNGGIVFNGTTSYADLNTTSLISGTSAFTIEAGLVTTGTTACAIIGNYGVGNTLNTLWFSARYGLWINSSVPYFVGNPIALGTYILTVTRDSLNNTAIYKNGVLNNTSSSATSINVSQNWRIGSDVATIAEQFTGTIYYIKAYNFGMTANQVLQNFNATRGRFGL